MSWKNLFILSTVFSLTVVGWFINNSLQHTALGSDQTEQIPRLTNLASTQTPLIGTQASEPTQGANIASSEEEFEIALIRQLRETYGDQIHRIDVQASLVEVKQYVLNEFPSDGESRFKRIIELAFPTHASSIIAVLLKLETYGEWVLENQTDLLEHSELERRGLVWNKRRDLFGTDADIIWAHELTDLAQRQADIKNAIDELDRQEALSIDEKLYQFTSTISEHFEGSAQEIAMGGTMLSKAFLSLDSIQNQLTSMTDEDRQETINKIRTQFGLDEETVQAMQAKDEERNKKWANGLAYMAERKNVMSIVDEEAQRLALNELQEQYFEHRAGTIAREEESGFFRFERPRVYGRN